MRAIVIIEDADDPPGSFHANFQYEGGFNAASPAHQIALTLDQHLRARCKELAAPVETVTGQDQAGNTWQFNPDEPLQPETVVSLLPVAPAIDGGEAPDPLVDAEAQGRA